VGFLCVALAVVWWPLAFFPGWAKAILTVAALLLSILLPTLAYQIKQWDTEGVGVVSMFCLGVVLLSGVPIVVWWRLNHLALWPKIGLTAGGAVVAVVVAFCAGGGVMAIAERLSGLRKSDTPAVVMVVVAFCVAVPGLTVIFWPFRGLELAAKVGLSAAVVFAAVVASFWAFGLVDRRMERSRSGGTLERFRLWLHLRRLDHDAPERRQAAAAALGRLGNDWAHDALLIRLGDEAGLVRRAAAVALAALGDAKWQDWVQGDEKDFARLAESADESAFERLLAMLDRSGRHVDADGAADVLGELGDRRAVPPLLAATSYSDSILQALVRLGDPRAVDGLIKGLRSFLGQFDAEPVFADPMMAIMGGAMLAGMIGGVRSRGAAIARALGDLGDVRAVAPLINATRANLPSLRAAAVEALGKLGGDRARAAVREAARDDDEDVRDAARKASRGFKRRKHGADDGRHRL